MRPSQALDVHAALAQASSLPPMLSLLHHLSREWRAGPAFPEIVTGHIKVGETYHVSEKAKSLVENRAAQLSPTSRFGDYEPPAQLGVAVLDNFLLVETAPNLLQAVHAFSWGPARIAGDPYTFGTLITLWHQASREASGGSLPLLKGLKPSRAQKILADLGGFVPVTFLPMFNDIRIGEVRLESGDEPNEPLSTATRIICAIWDLMGQTLAAVPHEATDLSKNTRRRARRAHLAPRITVIQLRKREPGRETGMGRPLDHRVEVKGHWRNQPYGSRSNPEYKRIWIKQHEKGPKGAPLVHTDKVHTLTR